MFEILFGMICLAIRCEEAQLFMSVVFPYIQFLIENTIRIQLINLTFNKLYLLK